MKICYVTLGFMPAVKLGGPVQNAYHLTANLRRRGHHVTVICTNLAAKNEKLFAGTRQYNHNGVRVIYFDTYRLFPLGLHSFGLFVSPGMIKFCRNHLQKYDVVHIDGYRDFPSLVASYFCRKHGIPFVLQPRGSIPITGSSLAAKRIFDLLFRRRMLESCASMIASSCQEESGYGGIVPKDKALARIYNGIDSGEFAELPRRGDFRRRHHITQRYLVTYIGRIHAQKGIDVLIRSMPTTRDRLETHLAIIGPNEGCKARLSSLAEKLGVQDSVTFLDALAGREKLEAYVDSDCVVYVTQSESFGMVPIEAAMCKVPAITSEGSACGEFLKAFGAGFMVPYGDPPKLAKAIDAILENTTGVACKVQIAAEGIRRALSWEVIAREYETAYLSALEPHRPSDPDLSVLP